MSIQDPEEQMEHAVVLALVRTLAMQITTADTTAMLQMVLFVVHASVAMALVVSLRVQDSVSSMARWGKRRETGSITTAAG